MKTKSLLNVSTIKKRSSTYSLVCPFRFSGLLSAGKENREADRDTFSPRKIEEDIPAKGIFAFPKGAAPGTFMHTVFETVPFDADRDLCRGICEDLLVRNGFSAEEWGEPVTEMVMQVLHAPLGLDGDEKKTFTLSQVASENRLHEMEFTFPLKCITAKALETELARWGYGAVSGEELVMEGLSFSPVKGYLKGFIDLIFQVNGRFAVLDWKSNHLGNCAERYTHETIGRTMNEHRYTLQFLLYTVAVRRHLMLKLGEAFDYDSHMAGALYLFVRGVDEKGHGVYFNRPEAGCIEALDRLLIDDEVKL